MGVSLDKTICLGEELVLDTDRGDAALLEFTDQTLHIIEIAVARIAIKEDWNRGRIGHEFQGFQDLSPAGFVVVADTVLSGYGEAAGPNPSKACLLDDFGAETIVGFTDEFQFFRQEELPKLMRLRDACG
ncbi:MAG: hypothetical protein JW384_02966 [Nitrosomonadaceae bacterium]|nr:hypothetical protein [Nitrosomonadaceae bacterium]